MAFGLSPGGFCRIGGSSASFTQPSWALEIIPPTIFTIYGDAGMSRAVWALSLSRTPGSARRLVAASYACAFACAFAACSGPSPSVSSSAAAAAAKTAASSTPGAATARGSGTTAPSPDQVLGAANAAAMDSSSVTANCTMAQLSTSSTAAANVSAFLSATNTALASTMGNVCLPPGTFPFSTVTLTLAHSGLHVIGTEPTQTFVYNQP